MGKYLGIHLGQPIADAQLWAARDQIRQVRADKNGRNVWYMQCPGRGCPRLIWWKTFRKHPKAACRVCTQRSKKRPYEALWNIARGEAKKGTRQEMRLSYEQFRRYCELPACHYCCRPITRHQWTVQGQPGARAICLDRLDSTKPYQEGNVVPCCTLCNLSKGAWLLSEEFQIVAAARSGRWEEAETALRALRANPGYDWSLIAEAAHEHLLTAYRRVRSKIDRLLAESRGRKHGDDGNGEGGCSLPVDSER